MWTIEILVKDGNKMIWKQLRPRGGDPYRYTSKERAERISFELSTFNDVRIVEVKDEM